MKKAVAMAMLATLACLLSAQKQEQVKKGEAQCEIKLRNGSNFVGITKCREVHLKTAFGTLKIPLETITSLTIGDVKQKEKDTVVTASETYAGWVELKDMEVDTGYGVLKIPAEAIASLQVLAIGGVEKVKKELSKKAPANEANAAAFLKQLTSHEAVWWRCDYDRNTLKDYWVRDVAGFHYMKPAAGNGYQLIDKAPAHADPEIGNWVKDAKPKPCLGYFFAALSGNDENGNAYRQNYLSADGTATGAAIAPQGPPKEYSQKQCLNSTSYGFVAYPAEYGVTGVNTYIVNQQGVVYRKDLGKGTDAKFQPPIKDWPAADPTTQGWGRAD